MNELQHAPENPIDWEHWVFEVEAIIGHSIRDGDLSNDGYSFDEAYMDWCLFKTPEEHAQNIRNEVARVRLATLAAWLNRSYAAGVVELSTAGPRQGLDDVTPFLQIARGHTGADVVVAVGMAEGGFYCVEVYTSAAWFNPGELPFTRLHELHITDAAHVIQRYIPYVPTV